MNRDAALRKVRACLRLSRSANANEAAAALRQARALMVQYGLTEDDAAEITCAQASTRSRGAMAPPSIVGLAQLIAEGYRCRFLVSYFKGPGGRGSTRIEFYGHRSDAQISAYAFTVLRRQLEADKSAYLTMMAARSRRYRIGSQRSRFGEMFALSWVHAVRDLFPSDQVSPEHAQALTNALARQGAIVQEIAPKHRGKSNKDLDIHDIKAVLAGQQAGREVRIHRGVGQAPGAAAPAQLEQLS